MGKVSNRRSQSTSTKLASWVSVPLLFLIVACVRDPYSHKPVTEQLEDHRQRQERFETLTEPRTDRIDASAESDTKQPKQENERTSEKQNVTLTLEEAVQMALGENQAIQIESLSPAIARASAEQALGTFDPEVYASVEQTDEKQPTGSRLSGARELISEDRTQRAGIRGVSAIGLEYDVFYELGRDESNSSFRTFDPQYSGGLGATVTQPLLEGFGPEVQLARYRARLNRLTKQQFETLSTINEQIYAVHRAYWNLVRAEEQLKIAENALELARETVKVNQAKYKADRVPEVDLLQARTKLAERREELEIRKSDVQDARDRLLQLISPPDTTRESWTLEVVTESEPNTTSINLKKEAKLIDLASETRMDLKAIEKEMEALDELLKQRRNAVRPNLDLELSYTKSSLDDELDASIEQIRDENFRTWSAGLLFSYPLWNRTSSSRERELQLEHRKMSLRHEKLETQVARDVRSGIRRMKSAKNRIKIARKSKNLAAKQLSAATARQEAGLTTTFRVLRLQDDARRAKSRLVTARVDYAKAYATLRKAMGMLVTKYLN